MKTRKQVYELTLADFQRHPVWEYALDEEGEEGQDEATVRPSMSTGTIDTSAGVFIVHASFVLSDGTEMRGYLSTPAQDDRSLGALQPVIITQHGQVLFWCGVIVPSSEHIAKNYSALGKAAASVFPIAFKSAVPLTCRSDGESSWIFGARRVANRKNENINMKPNKCIKAARTARSTHKSLRALFALYAWRYAFK